MKRRDFQQKKNSVLKGLKRLEEYESVNRADYYEKLRILRRYGNHRWCSTKKVDELHEKINKIIGHDRERLSSLRYKIHNHQDNIERSRCEILGTIEKLINQFEQENIHERDMYPTSYKSNHLTSDRKIRNVIWFVN